PTTELDLRTEPKFKEGIGSAERSARRLQCLLLCARSNCGGLGLGSAFDRASQSGPNRLSDAKIVRGECVLAGTVESQHGSHSGRSLKRDGQRRAKRAVLAGIVQVARFDQWLSVQNRFVVLCHPSR